MTVQFRPARLSPWWLFAAVGVLGVAGTVGLLIGSASLGFGDIVASVLDRLPGLTVSSALSDSQNTILWEIRFPRVVLAAIVGGTLAMCGAAYQGVFRNPLADPYLLGVAAGAGLGATLVIVAGGAGDGVIPLAAFAGAMTGVAATYALGFAGRRGRTSTSLILAGVAVAAFFTAIQTFVQQRNSDTLREVYSWILGRLTTVGWNEVITVLPWVAVSVAVLWSLRRTLDVLTLGDEEAASLGVNVVVVRVVIIVAASLGTAAVVAVSGLIGFVGIMIPHLIRLGVGTSYRRLLPLSFILGGAFLVLADLLARTVAQPAELPIGVITAFFGAPFFLIVLRTGKGIGA